MNPHRILLSTLLLAFAVAATLPAASPPAQAYSTVSSNATGEPGDAGSGEPRITPDGRYVVFHSAAANLVAGDTNGVRDVFVRDNLTGAIERVSVSSSGAEGDGQSGYAEISADGRYVVFNSDATNLVVGDTNYATDAFLRDRTSGLTERVSVSSAGQEQSIGSFGFAPAVSADGRFVAFTTLNAFIGVDYGLDRDVYLRDRAYRTTTLVSWSEDESQAANGWSPSMDASGALIAFTSNSSFVHSLDPDALDDVFLRDTNTASNELVSLGGTGSSGSGHSARPRISADGRYVVFDSEAADLDAVDTNASSDIFLRDRAAGTTELVSYASTGAVSGFISTANAPGCIEPALSDDGRYVIFRADNDDLTPLATPGVFLRDRTLATTVQVDTGRWWSSLAGEGHHPDVSGDGSEAVFGLFDPPPAANWTEQVFQRHVDDTDSILLVGDSWAYGGWGDTVSLTARGAPAGATWYLAWSFKREGSTVAGQAFDIGPGATVLASGIIAADGTMSYTSAPIPAGVAGRDLWLELAVTDGAGSYLDSNAHWLEVL